MDTPISESTISKPISPHFEFYEEERRVGTSRVSASYLRGEQVLVNFSGHAIVSDHPKGLGGTAMGPSPGELLLGSLAACTAIYVGREAKRHGVPVESVDVGTSFEVAWEPVDGPLDSLGYFTKIFKRVEITGDLTDDQLAMVRFWVEHCSIGETLRRGVELEESITVHEGTGATLRVGNRSANLSDAAGMDVPCCGADECDAALS